MPKLPELTPMPSELSDRLPFEVWGREAVHVANRTVAAQLNSEALDQYRAHLDKQTPADEAGWQAHLAPFNELQDAHMTPDEVRATYGSYTRMGALMTQDLETEYNQVQEDLGKEPELKKHLDDIREALKDISKDDHPDPKVREDGEATATHVGDTINKYAPILFQLWRIDDAVADGSKTPKTWTRWLAEDATDNQLLNFMQWHNARIQKYNDDPEIREAVELRRQRLISTVEQVYDAGFLHPEGRERNMVILKSAHLFAGDEIDLAIRKVFGHANPVSWRGVLQPYQLLSNSATFEHEMAHFILDADDRWANEAGADYLAGIVLANSLDVEKAMNMVMRDKDNGYQMLDEKFLEFFAGHPEGAKAFMRYVSAPRRQKDEALKQLNAAFDLENGEDFFSMTRESMSALLRPKKEAAAA